MAVLNPELHQKLAHLLASALKEVCEEKLNMIQRIVVHGNLITLKVDFSGLYNPYTLDRHSMLAMMESIDALWQIAGRPNEDKPPLDQITQQRFFKNPRQLKWSPDSGAYVGCSGLGKHELIGLFNGPGQGKSYYYTNFSPRNGLVGNLGGFEKATGEIVSWSDAAFAMWAAVSSYARSNVKNLRYIGHDEVVDEFTLRILNRAIRGLPDQIKVFDYHTREFLALLGTPEGENSVKLLTQHKRQLGYKTILRVHVFGYEPREWRGEGPGPTIVFEIAEMPDPASLVNGLKGLCDISGSARNGSIETSK
ncbi:MAG: hypothetical protein Q9209_001274 [Squamulea sp. 1 TL-2023]